jgi:hypothetical protein
MSSRLHQMAFVRRCSQRETSMRPILQIHVHQTRDPSVRDRKLNARVPQYEVVVSEGGHWKKGIDITVSGATPPEQENDKELPEAGAHSAP